MGSAHLPVLLDEVVQNLIRPEYRLFVDATVGGGGHTYSILTAYPDLRAYAIDLDETAIMAARERLEPFRDRVKLKRANFSALKQILGDDGILTVDAVLFDLGVSTFQLEGERGFSFKDTHALDMRMDQRQEQTALRVVNSYTFEALKRVIAEYGEEWKATRIARAIVAERKKNTGEIGPGTRRDRDQGCSTHRENTSRYKDFSGNTHGSESGAKKSGNRTRELLSTFLRPPGALVSYPFTPSKIGW